MCRLFHFFFSGDFVLCGFFSDDFLLFTDFSVYFQVFLYYTMTILMGLLISIFWGLIFGFNSFVMVYMAQPFSKITQTWFKFFSTFYRPMVRVFLGPIFEAIALQYSKVVGRVTVNMKPLSKHFRPLEV